MRRRTTVRRAGAALLMLAALPAARAEVVTIAWDADGRFERTLSLAPGKFAEVCGKLPAGAKVRWAFEAGGALDFNLHYHAGKEVIYPSKLPAATSGADTLSAEVAQDYCWMWSNRSAAPTSFELKLQR